MTNRQVLITRLAALILVPSLFWGGLIVSERDAIHDSAKEIVALLKDAKADLHGAG